MESKNSDEDISEIQRKDHSEENICGELRTGCSLHSAVVYSRLWVVPCVTDPATGERLREPDGYLCTGIAELRQIHGECGNSARK